MPLDRARLREILGADHSYYGDEPEYRNDDRLNPPAREFIASQLQADMRVLDVGCGNGSTLLANCDRFQSGLGIDADERHVALAEEAKSERGARNVQFMLLDLGDVPTSFPGESFDFAFSERGPVGYDSRSVQAVLSALRADGLIFCEVIGNLHHQEMRELFSSAPRKSQAISVLDQVRVAMERNGVGIRIAADLISKRYYPTIYDWLEFQCSIWAWGGGTFPAPDDPRLELFAQRNTTPSGAIETTHHVVWVGGVKLSDPPGYGEHQIFSRPSSP